ncbi:unnamed protein product [Ranitomeya imitator]|uniref:Proteasome activator complex subunit 4 C-terminal domain-containing protein n=1 Tax=Ranitomeya imitator TaxID=111125 RepID=A0ABN9M9Z7_9NEOB|nr:unnamed protein product [Ranitomeya imitator]
MVFYNLFMFLNNEETVQSIRWLVLQLMADEQLEVREMAATTLSGLLQCNFLKMDAAMQAHIEKLCKTRLPKKRKRELSESVDMIPSGDLVRRHAGVLGLSACILSSPYDVPTWMPQLLMDLSVHLNDPQPIEQQRYIWHRFMWSIYGAIMNEQRNLNTTQPRYRCDKGYPISQGAILITSHRLSHLRGVRVPSHYNISIATTVRFVTFQRYRYDIAVSDTQQRSGILLRIFYACNQGKHRVTKRGPALSYPMFTLVTQGPRHRWSMESCLCDSSPATTLRFTYDHGQVISLVVIVVMSESLRIRGYLDSYSGYRIAGSVTWILGELPVVSRSAPQLHV